MLVQTAVQFSGSTIVLHIFKKQGQKAPVDEIAVATKRMKDEIAQETARIQKAEEAAKSKK